jgi:hypothetical protein
MATYLIIYAGGSALTHKARRGRAAMPIVRDAKRAAKRETRRTLKHERAKAAHR